MFYYLYQITNKVNNKIYVGVHKTHDLNDGYMGSGKVVKAAIQKYGLDNFRLDIVEYFDSEQAMFEREWEIVTEQFLSRKDVYNLRRGGTGGFDFINSRGLNLYGTNGDLHHGGGNLCDGAKLKQKLIEQGCWEDHKKSISLGIKISYDCGLENGFKGKSHSDNSKRIIGQKNSKHQRGSGNSQFGKPRSQETKDKIRAALKARKSLPVAKLLRHVSGVGTVHFPSDRGLLDVGSSPTSGVYCSGDARTEMHRNK
jgi:hypothetical protein